MDPTRGGRFMARSMGGRAARPAGKVDKGQRATRPDRRRSRLMRALAWGVHLYTALGLVLAALIVVLLVRGGPDAYRDSFALMLLASIIDATDGTLARRINVKAVLPEFDGRKLDDLTDF